MPPVITLALEVFAHAVIVAVLWAHHGRAGRVVPASVAIARAVLLADTMATTHRRTDQALPGFQRLIVGNRRFDGPVSTLELPAFEKHRPAIGEVRIYRAT